MGLNASYASTIPAIFKIVECVLNILTIGLSATGSESGPKGWAIFVSVLTFIVSAFFYIIHLTNIIYKFSGPMTFIEFVCITISGGLQFIAMIVVAATARNAGPLIAAAVFFGINFVIYGIDAFFLFALYKVHGGYLNKPSVTQQIPPNQPNNQGMPAFSQGSYLNSGFGEQ